MEQHPGMKAVVVNEIERLLFRQNIRQSAQYDRVKFFFCFYYYLFNYRHYALCCLTAITFTSQDDALANKLIKIYFAVFRVKF